MRSGVLAGGSWIRDNVKLVDAWPAQDTLATIVDELAGNGGSPYNILVNLAKLGAPFPLAGVGLLGDDAYGHAILADCRARGIDTTHLCATSAAATSYTDVVTVRSTGRRTFFHQPGANALLDVQHFDFSATMARIFHLGYLLLLERLDSLADGRPRICEVLRQARRAGLLTSVDCVSECSGRLTSTIGPVLPEVDVFFANDFEASAITGIPLRSGDSLRPEGIRDAARALLKHGVGAWAIVHAPEAVFAAGAADAEHWQPSLAVPPHCIVGAAGAGDALAAGVLYGLHEGWPMARCLKLGVCVAAASLTHATCSGGISSVEDCLALSGRWGLQSVSLVRT